VPLIPKGSSHPEPDEEEIERELAGPGSLGKWALNSDGNLLLLQYPFNDLFSRTTWASQYQKGKPFWIFLEQEMMGWQWHQLDHMKIICTLLQT